MSVADRLEDALVTTIQGLTWGTVGSPPVAVEPVVVKAKQPVVTEQDGPTVSTPLVSVVVRRGSTEPITAGWVVQTYTVGFAVCYPDPQKLSDTGPMDGFVELIRHGIHGLDRLPGVSEFNEAKAGQQLPFDAASLSRNYVWGTLAFDVECVEDRP